MNLKQLRELKHMTQEAVAKLVRIERASYANIENGTRRPSVPLAKRLGAVLDFDWTEMFDDEETGK